MEVVGMESEFVCQVRLYNCMDAAYAATTTTSTSGTPHARRELEGKKKITLKKIKKNLAEYPTVFVPHSAGTWPAHQVVQVNGCGGTRAPSK